MSHPFYPFVENETAATEGEMPPSVDEVRYAARIAVFDDMSAAPRVEVIEPAPVRDYLSAITTTVDKLAKEQGGSISFAVIREVVENYIHAYFIEPTITILDGGNTIRFSDQGPGIKEKDRAMEVGTTSATEEMKKYIRGVGSGFPYIQEYMGLKGGSLTIEDNLHEGTVVTLSMRPKDEIPRAARKSIPAETAPQPTPQQTPPVYVTQIPQGYAGGYVTGPMPGYVQMMPLQPQPLTTSPISTQIPAVADISPGKRGKIILSYLREHEYVGPSELSREFGGSQPTWHRELKKLEDSGFLKKEGQKRVLTEKGRAHIQVV